MSGEKRSDGTVDQAGGENLLGGGSAFPLDEAAGELAGGVVFLSIVHREREEVPALGVFPLDSGHQHHRVAEADDDGPVGLFGYFPGLD